MAAGKVSKFVVGVSSSKLNLENQNHIIKKSTKKKSRVITVYEINKVKISI